MVHNKKIPTSGFALLITLVVVSVVISIGITLIDLTIKQLRLANTSKDSESAFHAANAGVECVRYWRAASASASLFEAGQVVAVSCFGEAAVNSIPSVALQPGVYQHDFQITWANNTRCSKVRMITLSSDPTALNPIIFNGIQAIIPGFPTDQKTCNPGGRCSLISVQGYNRPCGSITELGTIQREVLLDL